MALRPIRRLRSRGGLHTVRGTQGGRGRCSQTRSLRLSMVYLPVAPLTVGSANFKSLHGVHTNAEPRASSVLHSLAMKTMRRPGRISIYLKLGDRNPMTVAVSVEVVVTGSCLYLFAECSSARRQPMLRVVQVIFSRKPSTSVPVHIIPSGRRVTLLPATLCCVVLFVQRYTHALLRQ